MTFRRVFPAGVWGGTFLYFCIAMTSHAVNARGLVGSSGIVVPVGVGALSPDVIRFVVQNGEERRISLPKGADILKTIVQYCGSANVRRSYLAAFLAANLPNIDLQLKDKLVTKSDAELTIPGCLIASEAYAYVQNAGGGPRWDRPMLEGRGASSSARLLGLRIDYDRLRKGNLINGIPASIRSAGADFVRDVDARRLEDGYVQAALIRVTSAVESALELTPSKDVSAILDNAEVRGATEAFEIALRTQDIIAMNMVEDFSRVPSTVKEIGASAFAPGTYPFTARQGGNIGDLLKAITAITERLPQGSAVDFEAVGTHASSDEPNCPPASVVWPFDISELQKILDLRRGKKIEVVGETVLILDTGFPPSIIGTGVFSPKLFKRKVPKDEFEPFVWTTGQTPEPFVSSEKDSGHGIAVLSLALGGPAVLESNLFGDSFPGTPPKVLSMMGYALTESGLALSGDVAVGVLTSEIWGTGVHVGIANLSLRFSAPNANSGFIGNLQSNIGTMYVFAAGNDKPIGNMLEGSNIYPPNWGLKNLANIIVVGAHGADQNYSSFSNYGRTVVDIAAPGCAVPAYYWDSVANNIYKSSLSGTSMAAPLVSFALGLMKRDFEESAKSKARIVGSGRYFKALEEKVRSRRILDIPVAIATPFDAVRSTADGKSSLRIGRIKWSDAGVSICGQSYKKRDEIIQVDFSSRNNGVVHAQVSQYNKAMKSVAFYGCDLVRGEFSKLMLEQELVLDGGSMSVSKDVKLNLDEVSSITLCETIACYWMKDE